ncbi:TrfB-related DNA-binding protein [Paraburkholderia flagellata]|uniref:TrfB-related DNA-binding protein n=1 Tax=Paraburkholderia flagellata TaxID=2883241 RepID=UPI001F46FA76|nr:TrfB-related DNA-binding protein [Paraburkholderia flagellata]
MGRVSTKRLSAAAFARLMPWLINLDERRIEAARRAIVNNERQAVIAKDFGWTQQAVHNAVATIWGRFEKAHEAGFNPDESAEDVITEDMGPADWSTVPDSGGDKRFSGRLKKSAWTRFENGLADLDSDVVRVARMAIVDGSSMREIASDCEWTQKAVREATEQVWMQIVHQRQALFHTTPSSPASSDVPEGWVTLAVPPALVEQFREQIEAWRASQAAATSTAAARRRPRNAA